MRAFLSRLRRICWVRWSEVVVALDVTVPTPAASHDPAIVMAPLTLDDVTAGFTGAPGLSADAARTRLAKGDRCVVARVDGVVVAYVWITVRRWRMRDVGLEMQLRRGEAVAYDMVTAEEYRRRGIMRSLLAVVADLARQHGFRKIYGRVRASNVASLGTFDAGGFAQLARMDTLRICGIIRLCSVHVLDPQSAFADRLQGDLEFTRRGIMMLRVQGRMRLHVEPPWPVRLSGHAGD